MANKMIIDASHPEETRVVVLRGNRVEEFDFESASKRPLRGNIYLAKVTRVEPSLQAAFIDYGGNRHGFLAFSEIHPDYYQIPVADRQALLEEEAQSQREEEEEAGSERRSRRHRYPRRRGIETRTEDGETVSEPASMEELDAEGFDKKCLPRIFKEDPRDTEAGVYRVLAGCSFARIEPDCHYRDRDRGAGRGFAPLTYPRNPQRLQSRSGGHCSVRRKRIAPHTGR